jgi:hypothetical protein
LKNTIFSVLITFSLVGYAQDTVSVESSVYGIQTGFLGIWAHNEARLSNSMALRTEIGFDSGIWANSFYDGVGFLMTPVITAEPRYYYNLGRRNRKGKSIDGNSGNFLSLKTSYHPDWFVISNQDNVEIISDISWVPTYGIRRNIGKHFNYETGIGVGYQYFFSKAAGFQEDSSDLALNFHLRFGYRF